MEKYKILKQLGDGTYGSVLLGQVKDTPQEKVAIKRYEFYCSYLFKYIDFFFFVVRMKKKYCQYNFK
jgi:serine/threonine protein kinase